MRSWWSPVWVASVPSWCQAQRRGRREDRGRRRSPRRRATRLRQGAAGLPWSTPRVAQRSCERRPDSHTDRNPLRDTRLSSSAPLRLCRPHFDAPLPPLPLARGLDGWVQPKLGPKPYRKRSLCYRARAPAGPAAHSLARQRGGLQLFHFILAIWAAFWPFIGLGRA